MRRVRIILILLTTYCCIISVLCKNDTQDVDLELVDGPTTSLPDSTNLNLTENLDQPKATTPFTDYDYEFENITNSEPPDNNATNQVRLIGGAAASGITFAVCISATTPRGTQLCTAAILSANYLLVSSLCVYDATAVTVFTSTSCTTALTGTNTVILQNKYTYHPNELDLALIKTTSAITSAGTRVPINIAYKGNTDGLKDLTNKQMTVVGFGNFDLTMPAVLVLNSALMRVMPKLTCIRELKKNSVRPLPYQDCLNTESGTVGICFPADRSALVAYQFGTDGTYSLVGIISKNYVCGSSTPHLFTRVGPFKDFLDDYVTIRDNIGF